MLIDKHSISADEFLCLMYVLNVGGQLQRGVKVPDIIENMRMVGDRRDAIYMLSHLLELRLIFNVKKDGSLDHFLETDGYVSLSLSGLAVLVNYANDFLDEIRAK